MQGRAERPGSKRLLEAVIVIEGPVVDAAIVQCLKAKIKPRHVNMSLFLLQVYLLAYFYDVCLQQMELQEIAVTMWPSAKQYIVHFYTFRADQRRYIVIINEANHLLVPSSH